MRRRCRRRLAAVLLLPSVWWWPTRPVVGAEDGQKKRRRVASSSSSSSSSEGEGPSSRRRLAGRRPKIRPEKRRLSSSSSSSGGGGGVEFIKAGNNNHAPIAVCVSGLRRSFVFPKVFQNIWSTMVWPIVDVADVFFAVDHDHIGRKYDPYPAASASDKSSRPAPWEEILALFRPRYSARIASSDSLAESLAVVRAMVAAREAARGEAYRWVVRLRPDATYRTALPPYERWPRVRSDAKLVWATYIGGATCSRGRPRDPDRLGACADDNFAIATRAAFDAYASPWPTKSKHKQRQINAKASSSLFAVTVDEPDCHIFANSTNCAECRLGCALRRGGVRVGSLALDLRLRRPPSRRGVANDTDPTDSELDRLADDVIDRFDLLGRRRSRARRSSSSSSAAARSSFAAASSQVSGGVSYSDSSSSSSSSDSTNSFQIDSAATSSSSFGSESNPGPDDDPPLTDDGADFGPRALATEFKRAWHSGFIRPKYRLHFVVVEPCGRAEGGLVRIAYDGPLHAGSRQLALNAEVGGFAGPAGFSHAAIPIATAENQWLGCQRPPLVR